MFPSNFSRAARSSWFCSTEGCCGAEVDAFVVVALGVVGVWVAVLGVVIFGVVTLGVVWNWKNIFCTFLWKIHLHVYILGMMSIQIFKQIDKHNFKYFLFFLMDQIMKNRELDQKTVYEVMDILFW